MGRGITRFWFAAVIAAAALLPTGCTPKCPPAPPNLCAQLSDPAARAECAWKESAEENVAKRENRCPAYSHMSDYDTPRLLV
jgi:hypothetical protein